MQNLKAKIDIVRPEIDAWLEEDLIDYFRKDEGYKNVPDYMIRDVYKTYFNKQEDIKYECNELMYWWHEMLQNTSNYLLKTVTTNKSGYSFIATKHIMKLLKEEIEKDQDKNNQGGGDGNGMQDPGANGGGPPDTSKMNDNIKKKMEQTVQNAADEIQDKQDAQEALGGEDIAGKGPNEIMEVEERMALIKDVILNKREVGSLIKRSIKGFKKGFGTKTIHTEETLLEADVVEDLIDEHYLFNELLAMDVSVRDQESQMVAFDLFIDVSGSMSSGLNVYGKSISRIQMAIALACRMNNMSCLGDIYAFNGSIKKINMDTVWHLRPNGGTDIEQCMRLIKENKRPSVILTDGEDGFNTYTDNAFIMSIDPGNNSNYFNQPACKKMVQNRKYIQYDGKKLITPKLKN